MIRIGLKPGAGQIMEYWTLLTEGEFQNIIAKLNLCFLRLILRLRGLHLHLI